MKRRIRITTSVLSMLAVAGIIVLSACKELPEQDEQAMENNVSFEEMGRLHNELLSNYYDHRVQRMSTLDAKISELMDMSWKHLEDAGYSKMQIGNARRVLPEIPGKSSLKGILEDGFSLDTTNLADLFSENDNLSGELIADISDLVLKAYSGEDVDKLTNYVNDEFAMKSYTGVEDEIAQGIFVDIFNSSFTYWEEFYSSKKSNLKLKDSSKVIINDAIGGVIGTIFGPIGSVLTAAVFSVGTNEELKD